jgi:hypothetical protein
MLEALIEKKVPLAAPSRSPGVVVGLRRVAGADID